MKVSGNNLSYSNGKVIKAFEGSVGNKLLSLASQLRCLLLGQARFPLKATGQLSGKADNTFQVLDERLVVSQGGLWYSPNTISVLVKANTGSEQQAFFTIQHGEQSQIALNGDNSVVTFLHEPGKPLIVTGSNFATGATGYTQTVPTAGQVYTLTSISESHIEGELKTVGGDLISGGELKIVGGETTGELKEVCVEQGIDDSKAMLINAFSTNDGKVKFLIFVPPTGTPGIELSNQAAFDSWYQKLYFDNVSGTQAPALSQAYTYLAGILTKPIYLIQIKDKTGVVDAIRDAREKGSVVRPNTYFTVSETGEYMFFTNIYETQADMMTPWIRPILLNGPDDYTGSSPSTVTLEKDVQYMFEYNIKVNDPKLTEKGMYKDPDHPSLYIPTIEVKASLGFSFKLTGPYTVKCVRTEMVDTRVTTPVTAIDTRFSYTTPVITTDTRHTVSTITLNLTPVN